MAESVPVRCPACRREHAFTPPTFPCACGAPLTVPVVRGGVPTQVRQRTWKDSWVTVRCPSCGRGDDWPRPELGCACGVVIRLPVDAAALRTAGGPVEEEDPVREGAVKEDTVKEGDGAGAGCVPRPTATVPPAVRRPPFQPVTIRTGKDAVTAAAQYLKWLGVANVAVADARFITGIDVRGDGMLVRVDPSTRATPTRDVETLWLNCLNENASGAFFSLAGYARQARLRADQLTIALFVMDLTGTPQPVNDAADTLIRTMPHRGPGRP